MSERPAPPSARRLRVLLASYHFPPDAAVGGLRAAKFARYLSEFGVDPIVLTVEDRFREEGLDPSRLADLGGVTVLRTPAWPRVMDVLSRIKAVLAGPPAAAAAPAAASDEAAPGAHAESFVRRLKRYFISLVIMLPDEKKHWSIPAAFTAIRLVRRERIDWVFTSGPPHSVHLIGWLTRWFTGARWAADFRDPWINPDDAMPHLHSWCGDRIESWMEATSMRRADRVITTTERMRQFYMARYPSLPAEKFVAISNSIDTTRLAAAEGQAKFEALTITYAGTLYFGRDPEPLFRAVGALLRDGLIRPHDIRIKLMGACRMIEGVDTSVVVARHGLQEVVEVTDRVPYAQAVTVMQQSHLLLVLAPQGHRIVIPAKIFDYLGSGSAVLALADPGATSDLMDELRCGRCFATTDTEGLSQYLLALLQSGDYRRLRTSAESVARYDARYLAGRLAAELTSAPSSGPAVAVSRI